VRRSFRQSRPASERHDRTYSRSPHRERNPAESCNLGRCMRAPRILVDVPADADALAALQVRPGIHLVQTTPSEAERPLHSELICDAEILFCTYPPTNFEEMRCLKWIQLTSTGY